MYKNWSFTYEYGDNLIIQLNHQLTWKLCSNEITKMDEFRVQLKTTVIKKRAFLFSHKMYGIIQDVSLSIV